MNYLNAHEVLFSSKAQSLHQGLRRFGLDPKDWKIQETKSGRWTIYHRFDPDVSLLGQAFDLGNKWDWQDIYWAKV